MTQPPLALDRILRNRPGWYQGDFHCHTNHSDGVLSPQELLDVARAEGLDFLAITDHNTLAAYPHFGEPADLCVIPGVELTFDQGHFNVFGVSRPSPWLAGLCRGTSSMDLQASPWTMSRLMAACAGEGLLTSINHPLLAPWAWLDGDTDLTHLHCLEIWNDPSWPANCRANPQAVDLWTAWLNEGHPITAIGGSDFHRPSNPPGVQKPVERLGLPRTWVYAERLSGRAILAALRRRRAYVSMGPQATLTACAADGTTWMMGDEVGVVRCPLTLTATVGAGTGQQGIARLLQDGRVVQEAVWNGDPLTFNLILSPPRARPAWYRLDVWDESGQLLAITNPIFVGPRPTPARRRFADFVPR